MEKYFLMDIERTIGFNRPFYWKPAKHGYTISLDNAGLFSKEQAEKIVKKDLDNKTVMISEKQIFKILGRERKHEGNITV